MTANLSPVPATDHMHTHTHTTYACMHAHTHACMHTRACTHTHIHTHGPEPEWVGCVKCPSLSGVLLLSCCVRSWKVAITGTVSLQERILREAQEEEERQKAQEEEERRRRQEEERLEEQRRLREERERAREGEELALWPLVIATTVCPSWIKKNVWVCLCVQCAWNGE